MLPDSKTGAKTIFLNEAALDVLSALRAEGERQRRAAVRGAVLLTAENGTAYVIPGGKPEAPLIDLEKPWQRVRAKAHLSDVRLHDLRHSFASVAVAQGFSLPIIGGLLGHREVATTARYAHLASSPLQSANEAIARTIRAAMGQQEPTNIRIVRKAST